MFWLFFIYVQKYALQCANYTLIYVGSITDHSLVLAGEELLKLLKQGRICLDKTMCLEATEQFVFRGKQWQSAYFRFTVLFTLFTEILVSETQRNTLRCPHAVTKT